VIWRSVFFFWGGGEFTGNASGEPIGQAIQEDAWWWNQQVDQKLRLKKKLPIYTALHPERAHSSLIEVYITTVRNYKRRSKVEFGLFKLRFHAYDRLLSCHYDPSHFLWFYPHNIFSLLHRACCWVTQLLYQPLHIYIKFTHKTLKTLRHVSVPRPSSGSHIVLAKVTL